jgi:hypothetical protein
MRQFSNFEEKNIKILTNASVELAFLELTKTGLEKAILDATSSVRSFLEDKGIHNYKKQSQGEEGKIILPVVLINEYEAIETKASLYRPVTKKGDPRIWFSGINKVFFPEDIVAIFLYEDKMHIFDLSRMDISTVLKKKDNIFSRIINNIKSDESAIAEELLEKMKEISKRGFIESLSNTDTGIGRTLEHLLGIEMNSSKDPDYKGIELKSFREKTGVRKNLFAQVPDWSKSKFKSSREILENFSYIRNGIKKLYCSLSTKVPNSQGLMLRLENSEDCVYENSDNKDIGDFAVWEMEVLKKRLQEKHRETFWIEAVSIKKDGKEYFKYEKIIHTKKPLSTQFVTLLEQGDITLDHLIKEKDGYVSEKGPIFKIKSGALNLLFPKSSSYILDNSNDVK